MSVSIRLSVFRGAYSLLGQAARRIAISSLLIDAVGAMANATLLAIAGRLLGLLAEDATWSSVLPWLVASATALAVSMVASSVHAALVDLAAEHVESFVGEKVLAAAAKVPFFKFDDSTFYDRLRRAHESGAEHAWTLVRSTLSLLRGLLDMAAIVVVLAFVAPILIPIGLLAYVPLWAVSVVNNRAQHQFVWDETESDRKRSYIELLVVQREPAKEVRSFDLGPELLGRYRLLWKERLARLSEIIRSAALRSAAAHFASSLVVTSALGAVAWLTVRGDLNLEQAGVGVLGVRQLSNGVSRTSRDVAALHRSDQFLEDYRAFRTETQAYSEDADGPLAPERIDRIDVEGLAFTYPGEAQPSLRGIDLTMHRGQVTAVVGANGSGKTTLLMLLAGLYEPDDGVIRWDGKNRADFSAGQRRAAASPLFQDFVRFHFSVAENVALTDAEVTRISVALEQSESMDYVRRFASGSAAQLGKEFEGGAELSIGQWQRLALARALYKRAPIVLLDEPASALDPAAEARLIRRLRTACADQCVLMISHRFASVRQADHIFVLEEGRVIEHGSHEELVARNGAYNALYSAQARPSADPAG